ncbi:MAG: NYN domain-containing protein [Planctomycetes bacterium]|nr:NYN domain-containing protein [Planctomycetota bacterium]
MGGSTSDVPAIPTVASKQVKLRVFIDFWNFQLTLNEEVDSNFKVDWQKLPNVLARDAIRLLGVDNFTYEGTIVFTSYNPKTEEGRKYRNWATSWLDRQPGIQVKCFERRPRHHPKCPSCHVPVPTCPMCSADMAGTIEKGVDTAIATDMIRLAWEDAYDVAILATADADLVPAVEFLDVRNYRVLQAGFPPHGSHLSRACWATIDLSKLCSQFER